MDSLATAQLIDAANEAFAGGRYDVALREWDALLVLGECGVRLGGRVGGGRWGGSRCVSRGK